ncbi:hypothetical protein O3Q51_14420 [Cryomorphaceae bacterium 1068]|nr:hypothetical protein [Cryomorphaceae bacterium 1068]
MTTLKQVQKEFKERLPETFRQFFRLCYWEKPPNLVGTDLLNSESELKTWAVELLEENGIENFLSETDCVFMMHQGYQFWYFAVEGNDDPDVFHYMEGEITPKFKMDLNSFLKEIKKEKRPHNNV